VAETVVAVLLRLISEEGWEGKDRCRRVGVRRL